MNILYFLWRGGIGGGEKVVLNLVNGLNSKKFNTKICVWIKEDAPLKEICKKQGIEYIELNGENKFKLSTFRELIKVIKTNKIDLVHSHGVVAKFFGTIATKFTKAKSIITIHRLTTDRKAHHKVLNTISILLSNKVICVSKAVENGLSKIEKIIYNLKTKAIIYNGLDIENIERLSSEPIEIQKDKNKIYLLFVGRLDPIKGVDYLIKAMKLIVEVDDKYRLLIVGDGEDKKRLQSLTNELNLNKYIEFKGHQNNVYKYMRFCDVLVNPSFTEGFPLVILEALTNNLFIITTCVGGISEILCDYEYKKYIPIKSCESIACEVLNCKFEVEYKAEINKFKIENMIEEHIKFYNKK